MVTLLFACRWTIHQMGLVWTTLSKYISVPVWMRKNLCSRRSMETSRHIPSTMLRPVRFCCILLMDLQLLIALCFGIRTVDTQLRTLQNGTSGQLLLIGTFAPVVGSILKQLQLPEYIIGLQGSARDLLNYELVRLFQRKSINNPNFM